MEDRKGKFPLPLNTIAKTLELELNLTVTERAGSRLPKSSKMLITAEMSTIAQK